MKTSPKISPTSAPQVSSIDTSFCMFSTNYVDKISKKKCLIFYLLHIKGVEKIKLIWPIDCQINQIQELRAQMTKNTPSWSNLDQQSNE